VKKEPHVSTQLAAQRFSVVQRSALFLNVSRHEQSQKAAMESEWTQESKSLRVLLSQEQKESFYQDVKVAYERLFRVSFSGLRELLIQRNVQLSKVGKVKVNWKDLGAKYNMGELQAHETFRQLELVWLDRLSEEQQDFLSDEIKKMWDRGIRDQKIIKKQCVAVLKGVELIQYKHFDNVVEKVVRYLKCGF
jgi:hypothetical protein